MKKLKHELIAEINRLKPESFEQREIHTETQVHPIKKELYKPVVRKLLLAKMEKWLKITELAIRKNKKLIGIGD